MIDIKTRLKVSCPNYSDNIDRMWLVAKEIEESKDSIDSMNKIVDKLDAADAHVLGMINGEMIKDGTIRIEGFKVNIEM